MTLEPCHDTHDADYVATGQMLMWRDRGQTRYSLLYRPSAEALAWDKPTAVEGSEMLAKGSIFGGFSYVAVKVTGRKLTQPAAGDRWGTRCQATMNLGPDSLPSDLCRVTAWVTSS